ncbi:hypothetical protein [Kitasatospora sp. NPDC047058]|uniref:hypothetical protein n=1 Tax=Kitasatospora sp. NPDC047058 TaxID=3155620 RepID=UPI00340C3954
MTTTAGRSGAGRWGAGRWGALGAVLLACAVGWLFARYAADAYHRDVLVPFQHCAKVARLSGPPVAASLVAPLLSLAGAVAAGWVAVLSHRRPLLLVDVLPTHRDRAAPVRWPAVRRWGARVRRGVRRPGASARVCDPPHPGSRPLGAVPARPHTRPAHRGRPTAASRHAPA